MAVQMRNEAICLANIGVPTYDDEAKLRGAASAPEVSQHWQRLGCEEVVVKLGAGGCLPPDGTFQPVARLLCLVDTSGAGDAFNAGYLLARLRRMDFADAGSERHRLAGWVSCAPAQS